MPADKVDIEGLLKESKAEYRQLGKSGLRVSVPILGAMSIGSSKWQPWVIEEEEALPLLKAAWDRGLTTWDTGMPENTRMVTDSLHTSSKRLLERCLRRTHRQSD